MKYIYSIITVVDHDEFPVTEGKLVVGKKDFDSYETALSFVIGDIAKLNFKEKRHLSLESNDEEGKEYIRATLQLNNGFVLWKLEKTCIEDPFEIFAKDEAPFRLKEFFHLTDEQIEEHKDAVASIIYNVLNECESLYDDLDSNIREYLEDNNIEIDYGK